MERKLNPEDYRVDKEIEKQPEVKTEPEPEKEPPDHPYQATTTVSNLPSRGLTYNFDEVSYSALSPNQMTALYSGNMQNIAKKMRNILQECADRDILNFMRGDLFYLYLQVRQMSWPNGNWYYVNLPYCPECETVEQETKYDLENLDIIQIDESYEEPFEVSVGEHVLQLAYLNGRMEAQVEQFVKDHVKKFNVPPAQLRILANFAGFIQSSNACGNTLYDKVKWLLSLGPGEGEVITVIEAFADEYHHGIDWKVELTCPSCGHTIEDELPMKKQLLYPDSKESVSLKDYRS